MIATAANAIQLLQDFTAIGVALSAEKDHNRLLQLILDETERLANADGGTLYLVGEDNKLHFEILNNATLNTRLGGTSGKPISLSPIPLRDALGLPNTKTVAACAALSRQTINIEDAYDSDEFDFSGTRKFDEQTGYRSQSFLTVPLTNHENEVIGVLQLINKRDPHSGKTVVFPIDDQRLVESLASMAAVAITNKRLIDDQRTLFDAMTKLIATAIDEKSPHTAGHCRRIPILTDLIAAAACRTRTGALADFTMTEDERYELNIAAWLHDCGKITTPEYIIDKSTKLEAIVDRIETINTRLEVLKRDAEVHALRQKIASLGVSDDLSGNMDYQQHLKQLDDAQLFVQRANVGGEFMTADDQKRIQQIAAQTWRSGHETVPLLNADEIKNLQISRGTITAEERQIINNHMVVTIKMLESLPYPRHLRRVPEFAGGHHERMDGRGFPKGLTRDEMSIPARMMGIADIFEALTSRDRPYKKPMPLSQALSIMGKMKLDQHIDPDIFDMFVREKVYLQYAREYLLPEQIDEVDHSVIPGFAP